MVTGFEDSDVREEVKYLLLLSFTGVLYLCIQPYTIVYHLFNFYSTWGEGLMTHYKIEDKYNHNPIIYS